MNLKQLSILTVLVILIGGLGVYLYNRHSASWEESDRPPGQKLLGEFPLNDVAQVEIKQGKNEVNLVKQDDVWKVKERYNYPANFSELSEFLRKVWELKGVQHIPVGPSQFGRLDLTSSDQGTNSGTLVQFKDKTGKLIDSMLLGKKHMRQSTTPSPFGMDDSGWPDGRFVLVKADKPAGNNVWVVAEPFSNIEAKPESWINKDFVKIEKIKDVSVVSTNATNSWKLGRDTETGEMKLLDKKDNEELDNSKIYGVPTVLSSASIVDVVSPDTKPEALGLDKAISATIDTFDHFTYTVKVGKNTNDDNYPVRINVNAELPKERTPGKDEKPDDKAKLDKEFKEKNDKLQEKLKQEKAFENWTFQLSKWSIDPLLKTRSEILAAPKTNAPAAKVEGSITNAPIAATNAVPVSTSARRTGTNQSPASVTSTNTASTGTNQPPATNSAPALPKETTPAETNPVSPPKPEGLKTP